MHGLILIKINGVLEVSQWPWLRDYTDLNTELWNKWKTTFENTAKWSNINLIALINNGASDDKNTGDNFHMDLTRLIRKTWKIVYYVPLFS